MTGKIVTNSDVRFFFKKVSDKARAKANQATCCQNCFSVFFILGDACAQGHQAAPPGMKKKQKNKFGNKLLDWLWLWLLHNLL